MTATQQLRVTASLLMDGLGAGLYESEGQCLMELVRNGVVASMTGLTSWQPERAKVEIILVPRHPLSPRNGPAMIVLDHGSGLTEAGLTNYFGFLGASMEYFRTKSVGYANGASQKNMGRLAALALNAQCIGNGNFLEKIKNGYYLFSRTAPAGEIRFVSVIPAEVERMGGFVTDRFISPADTQLGPLKNIEGSFTAIVIPTPVFQGKKQIYEELKWHLPRERDKMFGLTICGDVVTPPPLEQAVTVTSKDSQYRAYLGIGETSSGGAWLRDSETGFRVASCQKMLRYLPEPLWFPDLVGDIFAPDLLAHQNSARSTLSRGYASTSNPAWNKFYLWLIKEVVPKAKSLFERDAIDGVAADVTNKLLDALKNRYGDPDADVRRPPDPRERPPRPPAEPEGEADAEEADEEEGEKPDEEREKRSTHQRNIPFRVRDEIYYLYRGSSLHGDLYCQVSPMNPRLIIVNVRGYQGLPRGQAAMLEHCRTRLLMAIGLSKTPGNPEQAMMFATQVAREL